MPEKNISKGICDIVPRVSNLSKYITTVSANVYMAWALINLS